MNPEFFSKFSINDNVEFIPMARHLQEMKIAEEVIDGKVTAVKFTEVKVFYDIYSPYWGKIFDEVTSEKVMAPKHVVLEQE